MDGLLKDTYQLFVELLYMLKKLPEEYIKGTLVSLRVPNKPLNVYEGLDYVEYKLPKRRVKPIKKKNII